MGDCESLLHKMTRSTRSVLWNDSCSIEELSCSIKTNGAVGATCNPSIVLEVLRKEMNLWKQRIPVLIREMPMASEEQVAWRLVDEMSTKAAKLLKPIFDREGGRNGRLSIQTNPKMFRNPKAIVKHAVGLSRLAENIIVKIPATKAGIEAMEETTYQGISVNATVCFSLPQAIAVAEAVERGLSRRKKVKDISTMGPVCTLMLGRLDDWLRVLAAKENIIANPWVFDWAGVAVMKRAYAIYKSRGYRLRLLSAAFRNHLHWSQLIGGDVVISPPFEWQNRFNKSNISIEDRMDIPVEPDIVHELEEKFVDFRRSFYERGMAIEAFDDYGPTRRTLRQFCKATDDLYALVRDFMLTNPDS